jgi:Leucine-rich repeat (LRR) protein
MGNELTKEVMQQRDLEVIDLSKLEFKEIPKEIKKCQNCVQLDLSNNSISDTTPELRNNKSRDTFSYLFYSETGELDKIESRK